MMHQLASTRFSSHVVRCVLETGNRTICCASAPDQFDDPGTPVFRRRHLAPQKPVMRLS
jgi:hypothetical protein